MEPLSHLVKTLLSTAGAPAGRALILAVDGRGGSGKTTLAQRLQTAVPGTQVVHTDDIAWMHSCFGWHDLMVDGVLQPLRSGRSVHYQPPAWAPNARQGHVDVDAESRLVILEGVGASRRELTDLIDAAVWVQSDWREAERRGLARDGGTAEALKDWRAWQEEEVPFIAADRPWERANVITCGTPMISYDPQRDVVLAPRSSR